jgi:hypothetical protein
MTAEKKAKGSMQTVGQMPCLVCGDAIPVKQQSNGLASVSCQWCGFQGYARAEHADQLLRKRMKPLARAEVSEPKPAAVVRPAAAPTEKPAKAGRSLLDL